MLNWQIAPDEIALTGCRKLLGRNDRAGAVREERKGAPTGLLRWTQALHAADLPRALDPSASQGQISLLVPDDHAFEAFELQLQQCGSNWAAFSADRSALRRLLLNHVVPAPFSARQLSACAPRLDTLGEHPLQLKPTGPAADAISLHDGLGHAAQILSSWQTGPLRHVHVLDRVLQPARNSLLDLLAQAAEHRDFLAALRATGLDALLAGHQHVTVLAPSNAGMARLAPRLGLRERELARQPKLLRRVLAQHLLPGSFYLSELPWGGQMMTAGGEALHLSALGLLGRGEQGQPLLPGSEQLARNGVLHRLDQALLPPSLQGEVAAAHLH